MKTKFPFKHDCGEMIYVPVDPLHGPILEADICTRCGDFINENIVRREYKECLIQYKELG
jgi:hypothetical protein